MANAAKVGLLVVVFIGLIIGSYSVFGRSLFAAPTSTYYAEFDDATGVTAGTQVQVAGVPVGTVTSLKLLPNRKAKLTLALRSDVELPVGTEATIQGSLIGIGNSPISLVSPPDAVRTLRPEATLVGRRASALESAIPNSGEAVAELTKTIAAARKLLEDPRFKSRSAELLANSSETVKQFGELAESTNKLLTRNQAQIDKALISTASALDDVQRITERVAILMERGTITRDTEGIVRNVRAITARTEKLVASVDRLVNDPELRGNADQIAANVAEITRTSKEIARNASEITERGVAISDNVQEITKSGVSISKNVDEITKTGIDITKNLKTVSENAVTISGDASEISGQVKGTLNKVNEFFNRRGSPFTLSSQLDLLRESDPSRWRTDVTFSTPLPDGTLYAGIFDAFEANRLTIQFGKPVTSSFQYRYGIYASKPGVGVDYRLAPRVDLRGDLFDMNDPRLDLRMRVDFGSGLHGWLGVDRVFKEAAPTIGIGVRR